MTLLRDEEPEATRPRRRSGLTLLVVLIVLVVLAGGAWAGLTAIGNPFASPPDYHGTGIGNVVVQVHAGQTASDIARTLAKADVVKSAGAFVDAAKSNDRSRGIAPGYYRLRHKMSGAAALALMLDPSSRVQSAVTIPEGFRVDQVLARIAEKTQLKLADLQAVARQPRGLPLPAWADGRLEGFLFPATYDFDPGTTAQVALADMVNQFDAVAKNIGLEAGAKALGYSPYDVVTVASLVEREAKIPADYGKVARVIYNRLRAHMPLQLDSTVNYALGKNKTTVTIKDTKVASPYNTYLHPGLPPTPIASPGERALQAALRPTPGSWLYFVTMDDAGHNAFATSYDDFLSLKARAERQRSP